MYSRAQVTPFLRKDPAHTKRTLLWPAGAVLLIGIFSYVVVLGKIEPIPEAEAAGGRPARGR